ncbi:ABC transporter permease [Sulfitobacter sp.]|jgi:putative hydroxymethylpyrimidine transport system permease protein|uniref:ABC transporter permease n=1 Tax=Sulfitobacter sp. TaxID=1903071 RepID=UPI000C0CB209|nr:ABC transporter permease [Roseobacter sp.]MBV50300.1 ABC transporter permease [Roseobacter sp.]PHR06906.1 MAG: ABC transporter permease [Sulfitobacter sp.]|tara:strand:+ start:1818 stop:2558 length:741 start_codon:yes stop_codon:yes gene_type:complete
MKGKDTLLTLVIGLGLWQAAVTLTDVPHFILPSPSRVAQALFIHRATIFDHTLATATEVVLGLVIGTILGTVTAVQLALFRTAERLILPILVFTQAVPVFALAPLLTLWFGYGIGSKIVMTVLIIFFPVTSAFHDGLTRTDNRFHDLAHAMGARKVRFMWHVQIPSALPDLGTGLKLAAVYAPIGAVIGEWVGASKGLGYLMLLANGRAKIDLMFASLIVLACLTVLLHIVVGRLALWLTRYAQGK